VYVAEDGGDFQIWQQQTQSTSGYYQGRAGQQVAVPYSNSTRKRVKSCNNTEMELPNL
jgi:hypothetical protein